SCERRLFPSSCCNPAGEHGWPIGEAAHPRLQIFAGHWRGQPVVRLEEPESSCQLSRGRSFGRRSDFAGNAVRRAVLSCRLSKFLFLPQAISHQLLAISHKLPATSCQPIKNPPGGSREGWQRFGSGLKASDVRRLKALRAFEQIELYSFTFVQCAISVFLDRGKMDEDVLASGALDKSVALRSVKPLDSSLLSHSETPFA